VATTKTVLRLTSLELNEVNRLLQAVADRLDKNEGWRGTPEFQADINLNSNKATNVADAVDTGDAVNLGQSSSAITTATGTIFSGIGFSQLFESAQQVITTAGALTIAHGLGKPPVLVRPHLICVTGESNYTADDILMDGFSIAPVVGITNQAISIKADSTNLIIRFGNNNPVFQTIDAVSGSNVGLTNTNWKIIFRAWA
jgi:hypothetical protein